jgi:hypothetical protein
MRLKNINLNRVHSENFNQFIKTLDTILKHLHQPKTEFLIRGVINVDYMNDNSRKKKL